MVYDFVVEKKCFRKKSVNVPKLAAVGIPCLSVATICRWNTSMMPLSATYEEVNISYLMFIELHSA